MHDSQDDRLALDGGVAALPEGPPDWPPDDVEVRAALEAALADGSWGRYLGPHVGRLSDALGELFGLPYAYACCSGTFAVELALRSLPVGPGDEVILAGYDFPGNFRAIEAIGARPVLVEIDPLNWNLDPEHLELAVSNRTRAVIVSHLHGGLTPMRIVSEIAEKRGLAVVEDICQAPAAVVEGRLAGTWGDVAALSFGGSKLLTSGRGGAMLTRHADVHQRARIFCEQGNHAFPLSELQAAVLLPQLAKLPARHAQRLKGVERLLDGLRGVACLKPLENRAVASSAAYYKVGFQFDASCAGRTRAEFIAACQAEGVAIDAGFRGFALRGEKRCRIAGALSECRRAAQSALVLHHPVLLAPAETVDRVAHALRKAAGAGRVA